MVKVKVNTIASSATKGKTVAAMHYDQMNPCTATRWQVTRIKSDDHMSGFVDLDGKFALPFIYTDIGVWQQEVKRTLAGIGDKLGFLEHLGNAAIPAHYDYAEIFYRARRVCGSMVACSSLIRAGRELYQFAVHIQSICLLFFRITSPRRSSRSSGYATTSSDRPAKK